MNTTILRSLLLVALATALIAAPASADPTNTTPHIVFIMMDDLGYGSVSAYDDEDYNDIATPEIDAFATEGMLFTQYSVHAPVCSPTRVSIFTGQDARTFNVRTALAVGTSAGYTSQIGIPDGIDTLPEMLQTAGYRTVHLGKWHVGGIDQIDDTTPPFPEFTPSAVGFDEWAVRVPAKSRNMVSGVEVGYWQEYIQRSNGDSFCLADPTDLTATECSGTSRDGQHFTDWLMDEAIAAATDHAANETGPLFLSVWMRAPHTPLNPPEIKTTSGLSASKRYQLLVEYADEQIGELLSALDGISAFDDALVVVTSDNGARQAWPGGDIWDLRPNGDLTGKKGGLFEGGTRVPMVVRWPSVITAGSTSTFPASSLDWYPTFASILGSSVSEPLLGQSIVEIFEQSTTAPVERDQPAIFESIWAARDSSRAVLDGPWKMVRCGKNYGNLLFDMTGCQGLDCDQGDESLRLGQACTLTVNDDTVHASHPDVVARLTDRWIEEKEARTEIDWAVDSSQGSFTERGELWSFAGGEVTLCSPAGAGCRTDDPRVNSHDQAFTFSLLVRPDATTGSTTSSWLAGRDGSWTLEIAESTTPDTYDLTLTLEVVCIGTCTQSVLSGSIPAEAWSRVTWNTAAGGLAALFVDGTEVDTINQSSSGLGSSYRLASTGVPVTVGARDDLSDAFRGQITDLRMFTNWLEADQRDAIDRDEVELRVSTLEKVDQIGDVFVFDDEQVGGTFDPGMVTLCADDTSGCTKQHPIFEVSGSAWTTTLTAMPAAYPATGQRALLAGKNDAWRLYLLDDGRVEARLFTASTVSLTSTTSLPLDERTQIVLSFDEDVLRLQTGDEDLETTGVGPVLDGPKSIVLGARGNGAGGLVEGFEGEISGVRFLRALLDAEERKLLGRGEVRWQPIVSSGSPRFDRGVIFFDHAQENDPTTPALDQVVVCGDQVAGLSTGACPQSGYPLWDVGRGKQLTMSLEVRPDDTSGIARIAGLNGTFWVHLVPGTPGAVRLRVYEAGGTTSDTDVVGLPPLGEWTSISVTFEPNASGTVRATLRVDDVESTPIDADIGFDATKSLVLGSHFGTKPLRGALRDVRLFVDDLIDTPYDPEDVFLSDL